MLGYPAEASGLLVSGWCICRFRWFARGRNGQRRGGGMERADSLAFDLHKWMYVNYEVGCALVRWQEEHRATFVSPADYLAHLTRGLPAGPIWFSEYGVQLSRGFRALKVWMSLKEHGVSRYARLVEQNCEQAAYLKSRVEADSELELMAPVPLNIVCFRFAPPGMDPARLDG